jgi:hypothetical protein
VDLRDQSGQMHPAVQAAVGHFVADLKRERIYPHVLGVVICGSAARGEERCSEDGNPVSDIDVMVVTDSGSLLLGRAITRLVAHHASGGLEGGMVPLKSLREHRTLVNYDAKHGGRVVDGSPALLDTIPMTRPDQIARWEAVRVLFNRLFEHLKLVCGATNDALCAGKSYEALAAAELVLEDRFTPSFRLQRAEVETVPLQPLVPDLQAKFLLALALRENGDITVATMVRESLADLRLGIDRTLSRYMRREGSVQEHLLRLSREERHWQHRLYWFAKEGMGGRLSLSSLVEEPILTIWRDAFEAMADPVPSDARAAELLSAWRSCPQIHSARSEP